MAPFKPKDKVYLKKKPHTMGVIVRVAGKHQWDVQFEGDFDETQGLKSQQLLRNKPTGNNGNSREPASNNSHLPVTNCPPRLAAAAPPSEAEEDEDDTDEDEDAPNALPAATDDGSIDNFTFSSSEEEEDQLEDDEEESPAPLPPPPHDADEDEAEDVPAHGEIPVEPEDVHKAKWESYVVDKTQLLSDG